MRSESAKPAGSSIGRFIAAWSAAIVFAFALLSIGLVYSTSRLHAKTSRIFFDSRSLQVNHGFESAVLDEGREDLLWRTTSQPKYLKSRQAATRQAASQLAELVRLTDSPYEAQLVREIQTRFKKLRQSDAASTPAATQTALDDLLEVVHRHRNLNDEQMAETVNSSNRLDFFTDRAALLLICAAMILIVAGSIELWSRIVKPTLQLTRAARRFGAGDLQSRAPVMRADEMGALTSTFNAMAEAICLREKERLEFVATVAHDLKTPLVVIGGAAHLLLDKDYRFTPEEKQQWLGRILNQTTRLEGMISDLTDGVQAETGRLTLHCRPLDFALVTREIIATFSEATPSHSIQYKGAETCPLRGDQKRLERVIANLLSNAIKYSARGSSIAVSLEVRDECTVLTVRDQGVGIAEEDLPKLFLPFSRLDHTRHMAKGTGLGLCSVKKIVEAHGGILQIQSELGVGTTMEVRLPLDVVPDNSPASSKPSATI